MKKSSDLSRLLGYAGGRRVLTYLSWVLSAVSALVALVPFWYIWRILKEVLETAPDFAAAIHIVPWGWRAVGFAVLSVLLYIAGLMCSHLAAFRIATNLRLALTEHIARLAKVDEFAEKLPDGWNTNIGENGCQLSGGERQRVSIARAFLKDAPIILLDEATASLDVENETAIQTSLSRLIQNKTVLMIAHRMRTVAGADKIVVLKDGAVAEEGSPAQLRQSGGIFAHMEQLQQESSQWKLG